VTAQDHAQHRLGLLLVTVSAVAWSSAGFFTRLVPVDAWTTLVWRGLSGGLFGTLFALWWMRGQGLAALRGGMGWPGWLVTGLSTLGMVTFIPALKLTSVAHVAIIYATVPFITGVFAWLWLREPLSARTLAAGALAFAGVLLTLGGTAWQGGLAGDLLALLMTIAMALAMVAIRRYRNVALVPTSALSNLLGVVISLPFAAPLSVDPRGIAYLVLFGLVQMALGLTLFLIGSRLIPAAQAALIGALETPLAPLWVWLAFGETPSANALLGGAIVIAAVVGHVLLEERGRRLLSPAGVRPSSFRIGKN
jgi:drug/metabolite transporter (DMT)-like permease